MTFVSFMRELCRERLASKLEKSGSKVLCLREKSEHFPEQTTGRKRTFLLATIIIRPSRRMTNVTIITRQKSAPP